MTRKPVGARLDDETIDRVDAIVESPVTNYESRSEYLRSVIEKLH